VPTGRVKWYDTDKGFGFLTSDDGSDVFVHKAALPSGVDDLKTGQRVEFGVVESLKGNQALQVKLLEAPPSVVEARAEARRRPPEELHGLIEDMIKVLEAKIQPDLRRGRFPDKKSARVVAEAVHAVARELEV
jgi:CspA family cold shock protein